MSLDDLNNVLLYPSGVKRIAVCLYGCYRTGDYVLPWLKKSLTHPDVHVDYFCSARNYDEYRTVSRQKPEKIYRSDDQLIEKLSILNPTSVEIQDYEITRKYNGAAATEKSMADAIMLKQIHEATTGIEYDIVLLARYDTLAAPMASLAKHIATIGSLLTYGPNGRNPLHGKDLICNARGAWIGTCRQQHGLVHSPWADSVHDYFVVGSSVAMDIIAIEFLKQINPNAENYKSGIALRHTHMTLGTIIRQQDIQLLDCMFVRSTIIRPYADLTLDPTIPINFNKLEITFRDE